MLEGDECLFWEKIHPMDGGRLRTIMQKQGYAHSKKIVWTARKSCT
jgi:hypothetical protein